MRLAFTKMHGLGNDFVVIDGVSRDIHLSKEQIRALGDRHFGIGFDQLLLVEPSSAPRFDFSYRIFNADGSEVENCGNGARCFARFVRERKLTAKKEIRVQTSNSQMQLRVNEDQSVAVDMGTPVLSPADIPLDISEQKSRYDIDIDLRQLPESSVRTLHDAIQANPSLDATVDASVNTMHLSFAAVSMGNPHAVVFVDKLDTFPVDVLGPLVENHCFFPNKVNVGFLQIHSINHGSLRVFERGAGETIACGTGACAAAAIGMLGNRFNREVSLELRGGKLSISWPKNDASLTMTGPAETVFYGHINI